ncbi:MAG: GNAT family N-acetyltransferase [Desulfobulbaceae bacterium]|nr:GNAT family N-acetyltransferase [Desulfobulbaceae bacterium]
MDQKICSIDEILRDGGKIHTRLIHPDDKKRLIDGFHHLSKQSIYFRFLGSKKELTESELIYFTETDYDKHIALVATIPKNGDEEIIAVGRYIETEQSDSIPSAEVALAVVDNHQNRGIGSILFEKLMKIARSQGVIQQFEAYVFPENKRMIEIFNHHGFDVHRSREDDLMYITCSIYREYRKSLLTEV